MSRPRPGTITHRIVEDLTRAIQEGVYPPGSHLPPRRELCATYGVSPVTARLATQQLAADGYVIGRQGSGIEVIGPNPELPHQRRWTVSELQAEIYHLNHLTVKWMDMADRDGFLHPAAVSELAPACFRLQLMVDRIWQQREQDEGSGT